MDYSLLSTTEDETKSISVTYTFLLPEHEYEKKLFDNAYDLLEALEEIDGKCRQVMKYEPNASDDKIDFADQIREIIGEATGRFQ